jgi:hypothetical protein
LVVAEVEILIMVLRALMAVLIQEAVVVALVVTTLQVAAQEATEALAS